MNANDQLRAAEFASLQPPAPDPDADRVTNVTEDCLRVFAQHFTLHRGLRERIRTSLEILCDDLIEKEREGLI